MKLYRFLTGTDNSAVRHRVSAALADGWELHGGPVLSCDAGGKVFCGQAIVKETPGAYSPDLELSKQ